MRKQKLVIWIIAFILLILILPSRLISAIRSKTEQIIMPASRYLYQESAGWRHVVLTIHDLRQLPKENQTLNDQVAKLLVENAQLKEVQKENDLLRSQLKIVSHSTSTKLILAHFISRNIFSFQDIATVDQGSSSGVVVNQPVTLDGALVGRVITVYKNSAEVELITSNTAITQAKLQDSGATGIVRGGIQGLVLDYIPQDVSFKPGENVLTSGLGGSLPPDLLIGTIIGPVSQKNDIFQSFSIQPAVNISRADLVFIEASK